MPMVSWQTLVGIAFDVAEDKGASFRGIEDGASFMEDLGMYWSENKDSLKQMTEKQARSHLQEVVQR